MQNKTNPLGQYLRDFYEKMKGEKFDIDAWRQQSRKESDSDFVIETSKLHKIQIKSGESVEDSFKVCYYMNAPEAGHFWAAKLVGKEVL